MVRSYEMRCVTAVDGVGPVTVRESFRVSGLGDTTVERPSWLSDALAAD